MYAFVTLTDCNKPRGLIKTVTQTEVFLSEIENIQCGKM